MIMPKKEKLEPRSIIPLTNTQPPNARRKDIILIAVIFSPNIILAKKIPKIGAVASNMAASESDVMLIAAL